jgi:hypothetical protein
MASFLADPFFPSTFRRSLQGENAFARLPATMPPKLPPLEGLLKRLHRRNPSDLSDISASTDDESVGPSSAASSPSRMPSLRSLLSPALLQPLQVPAAAVVAWDETSDAAGSESDAAPLMATATTKKASGSQRSRASKYCKVDGCERVSQRNNLCHSHGGKRLCKEDGCDSKDRGNGYCIKHGGGKICSIGGCDKKARRKGLCTQHFRVCDSLVAPYY